MPEINGGWKKVPLIIGKRHVFFVEHTGNIIEKSGDGSLCSMGNMIRDHVETQWNMNDISFYIWNFMRNSPLPLASFPEGHCEA